MENSKETQINENSSAQIAIFTKKFNADPSDGIKYLIEEKIVIISSFLQKFDLSFFNIDRRRP